MPNSSGSGPSATGRRHGRLLLFWLLVTIGSVWTQGPGIGLPGGGWYSDDEEEPEEIRCPVCHTPARLKPQDRSYECANRHISRKQPDGSYKWEKDPAYVAPSTENKVEGG